MNINRDLLLWALLFLVVSVPFALGILSGERESPGEPAAAPVHALEQNLLSRYALGLRQLSPLLTASGGASPLDQLIDQLDDLATTPEQRVRVIPILAELRGADAALGRIDQLRSEEPSIADQLEIRQDLEILNTVYADGIVDDQARVDFSQRHNWYAELALSYGRGDDSPPRDAINDQALRTVITLGAATVVGIGLATAGLVLFTLALILRRKGRLATAYRPIQQPAAATSSLLETVLLFLAGLLLTSIGSALLLNQGWDLTGFLPWLLIVVPFWPLRRGMTRGELREAFGWHSGQGAWRELGSGLVGYVAGIPLLVAGLGLTFLLTRWTSSPPAHPLALEITSASFWRIVQLYLLGCVWAPLMEETMFRGALYGKLRQSWRPVASAALTGLLFALLHPQGWAAVPVLASIGTVLALIREWRGSILAPAAAHAANNFSAFTLAILILG